MQEKHEGRIYLFICGQYHFSVDTGFLFSKKASSPPPPHFRLPVGWYTRNSTILPVNELLFKSFFLI